MVMGVGFTNIGSGPQPASPRAGRFDGGLRVASGSEAAAEGVRAIKLRLSPAANTVPSIACRKNFRRMIDICVLPSGLFLMINDISSPCPTRLLFTGNLPAICGSRRGTDLFSRPATWSFHILTPHDRNSLPSPPRGRGWVLCWALPHVSSISL